MYASRLVEYARVEDLFDRPQHPYTEGLFRSIPKLGAHATRLQTIPGTVPNPARFPSGCKFHPRCHRTREIAATARQEETVEITASGERVRVMRNCQSDEPSLREVQPQHWAACHYAEGYPVASATKPMLNHRRGTAT